ncbi:MAG: sigma-70 family RNA polymerase sigma factor [Pirellulales bacterium]|nr:sigma-70 family RNA polymerase sigma factor [Pirellulales bacterium]
MSRANLSDAELLATFRGELPSEDLRKLTETSSISEGSPESARQEAFRLLVLRHGRIVMSVCRSVLQSEADAEDAFQATFFVLARKSGHIQRANGLAAWLHRVAMRISLRARKRRQDRKMQSLDVVAETAGEELRNISAQANFAAVHEAVARLPEPLRSTVLLTYFEGLTRAETAVRLGITPGVVQGRLKKARGQLRRRLALCGASLAALTALPHQQSVWVSATELVHLADTCTQTVFHVQAGLAASEAAAAIPHTLAHGVIQSMTLTTTIRHALVVMLGLACAWVAMGSAVAQSEGPGQVAASPTLLSSDPISAAGQTADVFVSTSLSQASNANGQDQSDQQKKKIHPGEPAWGKKVDGLQAALRLKDKTQAGPFEFGDTIDFEFVIRNVSDKPVEFESAQWREDDRIFVAGADGKPVDKISTNWYSGIPRIKRYKLAPGEQAVIDSGPIGIAGGRMKSADFKHPVVYVPTLTPGKYKAAFQLRIPDVSTGGDQGWTGFLQTGDLEFEVKQPGAANGRGTIK